MKKVLFVATITLHINTFHIPYLKWFKEHGYQVHVASRGNEKIEYCDKHFDLPFERFPLKINNIKTYKELKKIIDENNYDIIHCHTPTAGVLTRLAARKARKKGTRVFYTAHGFHFYKGAPVLNWIIYYPLEKICSKFTDCLITITQEDYELAKRKFKAQKIEHINGVGLNTERLKKELSEFEKVVERKKLGIAKDDIVFSYIAELNKNKNQIMLIKMIERLKKEYPNIKLLLVGNGPLYDEYSNYIEEKNLKKNVQLLGRRSDINEILSITDIYLASSIREGLPVNVMEAMYKENPIIATNNRGHRELIKENNNGFVIGFDLNDLVKVSKKLIEEQNLRNIVGKNGRKIVEKYTIKNVMDSMKNIYYIR